VSLQVVLKYYASWNSLTRERRIDDATVDAKLARVARGEAHSAVASAETAAAIE
jgi:hypothetical protein